MTDGRVREEARVQALYSTEAAYQALCTVAVYQLQVQAGTTITHYAVPPPCITDTFPYRPPPSLTSRMQPPPPPHLLCHPPH